MKTQSVAEVNDGMLVQRLQEKISQLDVIRNALLVAVGVIGGNGLLPHEEETRERRLVLTERTTKRIPRKPDEAQIAFGHKATDEASRKPKSDNGKEEKRFLAPVFHWTEDKCATVIDMMKDGYPYSVIARKVGTTEGAVGAQAASLKKQGKVPDGRYKATRTDETN